MRPLQGERFNGDVDANSNLEEMIAKSDGDTSHIYRVTENGETVGQLDMKDLVKALVPRLSGTHAAN